MILSERTNRIRVPAIISGTLQGIVQDLGDEEGAFETRALALDETSGVWFVERGRIEIFLVDDRGRRHHLATAEAGTFLFGSSAAGRTSSTDPAALLAVGQPGNRLVPLDTRAFFNRAGAERNAAAMALNGWIESLQSCIEPWTRSATDVEPRPDLQAGTALRFQDEFPRTVSAVGHDPGNRVVWVRHQEGNSTFLGREGLEIGPREPVIPITPRSWLQPTASGPDSNRDLKVSCLDTEELLGTGELLDREDLETTEDLEITEAGNALTHFHTLLHRALSQQLLEQQADDRQRLAHSLATGHTELETSHTHLAAVLEPSASKRAPIPHGANDPLLAA